MLGNSSSFSPAYACGESPLQNEFLQSPGGEMTPRTPGFGGSPTARSTFLSYKLQCGVGTSLGSVEEMVAALESEPIQMRSVRDIERLLQSDFCDREQIAEQLKQKTLLDGVYDAGKGRIWKVAQFSMFPSDCKGSFQHRTRSGDKLQEISEWLQERRRLSSLPEMLMKGASPASPSFFLDLCAGPGTWSDWLLDEIDFIDQRRLEDETHSLSDIYTETMTEEEMSLKQAASRLPGSSCYGFGISLNISDLTAMKDTRFWHIAKEVTERHNYESITALNNSGNLYCSKNLKVMKQKIEMRVAEIQERCASLLPQADSAAGSKQSLYRTGQRSPSRLSRSRRTGDKGVIKLIVADGGITIPKKSVIGEHLDNYQELLTGRLLLSEFLIAFQLLQHGGTFICTVFDSFSSFTVSLLYLCTALFEEVYMVKPSRNRWTNSERQIVALKFRRFRSVNLGTLATASTEVGEKLRSLPASPALSRAAPRPERSLSSLSSSLILDKRPTVIMFPRVSRVYGAAVAKLTQLHEALSEAVLATDYYTVLPETIFRRSFLKNDAFFVDSYRRMCVELCRLQCISLQQTYAKFLELQRNPGQLQELIQRQRTLERCMNSLKSSAATASISLVRPSSCDASQYAGGDTPSPYGGDRTRRTLMDMSALSPGTQLNDKYACGTERGPNSPGLGDDGSGGGSGHRTFGSVLSPASAGGDEHDLPRSAAEDMQEKEIEADWWRVGERRRQRGKGSDEGLGNKTGLEPKEVRYTQAKVDKGKTNLDWSSSRSNGSVGREFALSWRNQDEKRCAPGPVQSDSVQTATRPKTDTTTDHKKALLRAPVLPSASARDAPLSNNDFWCGLLSTPEKTLAGVTAKNKPTHVSLRSRNASEERATKADNEMDGHPKERETKVKQTAGTSGKTGEGSKNHQGEAETAGKEKNREQASGCKKVTNGTNAEVIYLIQAPEADLTEEIFGDETLSSHTPGSVLLSPQATGEDGRMSTLVSQSLLQNEQSVSADDTDNDACVLSRIITSSSSFALAPFSGGVTENTRENEGVESDQVLKEICRGERGESREGITSEEADEENAAHTAVSLIESVLDCELGEVNVGGEALAARVTHTRVPATLLSFNAMAEPQYYGIVDGVTWRNQETSPGCQAMLFFSRSHGPVAPKDPVISVSGVSSADERAVKTKAEKASEIVEAGYDAQHSSTTGFAETTGRNLDTQIEAWSSNVQEASDGKTHGASLQIGDASRENDLANTPTVVVPLIPKASLSSQPKNLKGRTVRSHVLGNTLRRRIANQVLKTLNTQLHDAHSGSPESCPVGLAETHSETTALQQVLPTNGNKSQRHQKRESLTLEEVSGFFCGTAGRVDRCAGGDSNEKQKAPLPWKHAAIEEDGVSTVSTLPTETIDIGIGIHVDESP